MVEELTGIYEQLTPLQFHFTEKPAQILQIPSLNLNLQILVVLNSRNLCKQMNIVTTYLGQLTKYSTLPEVAIWRQIGDFCGLFDDRQFQTIACEFFSKIGDF